MFKVFLNYNFTFIKIASNILTNSLVYATYMTILNSPFKLNLLLVVNLDLLLLVLLVLNGL